MPRSSLILGGVAVQGMQGWQALVEIFRLCVRFYFFGNTHRFYARNLGCHGCMACTATPRPRYMRRIYSRPTGQWYAGLARLSRLRLPPFSQRGFLLGGYNWGSIHRSTMALPELMPVKRRRISDRVGEYDPTAPKFWELDTVAEVNCDALICGALPYPVVVVQKFSGRMTSIVARCDAYPLLWMWPWFWLRVIDSLVLAHGFLVYLFCVWAETYVDAGEIPSFKSAMQKVNR